MWLLYSLLTAFTQAGSDVCVKGLGGRYHPWQLLWARSVFWGILAVLILPTLHTGKIPLSFWEIMAADLPLELAAIYLYWRAIEYSPISLVLPFLSFTPLLLLATSPILTGEGVSTAGGAGVLLVTMGSYILLAEERSPSSLLRTLKRERGCQLMLGVATIYSITANLGKLAIEATSPTLVAVVFAVEMVAASTVILAVGRHRIPSITGDPLLAGMGVLSGLSLLFHCLAINLVQVPYMIAIKRTSALWGLVMGLLIFKEKRPLARLTGGTLMVAGAVVISLWG